MVGTHRVPRRHPRSQWGAWTASELSRVLCRSVLIAQCVNQAPVISLVKGVQLPHRLLESGAYYTDRGKAEPAVGATAREAELWQPLSIANQNGLLTPEAVKAAGADSATDKTM